MDQQFFKIYMKNEPMNTSERFIFLVDSEELSKRITFVGFRSTPIVSYDTDNRCFTLQSFLDYMESIECKGTCRSDYVYVVACSTKNTNDRISSYLSKESLTFRPGWRLFRGKGFLEEEEQEDQLQKLLSDYVQEVMPGKVSIKALNMDDVQEEEVDWLIPGYIPSGQISLLVGDGGQGKTSVWCNILAGITTGQRTLLDESVPFEDQREPRTCMFFSSEDSVPKVLKRRLRKAGADASRILFVDLTDPNFDKIKFDAPELEDLVAEHKPALVVFDPLQSFIPPSVQMGSRNAMRQCLSPLIALGEKYGTAFLIVMHTNKKTGASGRGRCADSADIWDIARSILIVGYTGEKDLHYLSHEKCNYSELGETILYTIEDSSVVYQGTSDKKDKDYMQENAQVFRAAPAKSEAKEIILEALGDGKEHKVSEIDAMVRDLGVSFSTLKRSKAELKAEKKIKYRVEGYGKDKTYFVKLSGREL